MFQLKNCTPFAASMTLFPNEQGIDTLYLMVKASFKMGQQWTLIEEQTPPIEADEYWGEPNESSIKYASDFHIGKPVSDIIMIGNACSPNAEPVQQLDVNLEVGQVNKTVRVFGDRVWKNGQITAAEHFQTMPLMYEKAFGGSHIVDENEHLLEDKNPVGSGFAGKRSLSEMDDISLPNLEDPAMLIKQHTDQPEPACFAFSSPTWKPRVDFVGTYDETWQMQRAPYLPEDFNRRFFNAAHSNLIYPGYLQGGVAVHITNMHPSGNLQFNLPHVKLVSTVNMDKKEYRPEFNLETLIIEPNKLQLDMVWRTSVACDKKVLKVHAIDISITK